VSDRDRNTVREIVFEMDGALGELENTVTALLHSVAMFAEVPTGDDDPGDLDYFVADALAAKLQADHRLLREKWKRLFDLTRSQKAVP
jgi:hypothetical protein